MELDHLFICVDPGAMTAEALAQIGLTEGSPNRHPGQGTANRRFFFGNTFLELLYLEQAAEATSELTKPTRLYERLTQKSDQISPFGICFRPTAGGDPQVPFASWSYQPTYLPPHLQIAIGEAPLQEPMWLFLSFGSRPDQANPAQRQPLEHSLGVREVTSVQLMMPPVDCLSEAALSATGLHNFDIVSGDRHHLRIGFDGEKQGRVHDFQPLLPLTLSW